MTTSPESPKMSMLEPEVENRDPNGINTHSVVTFCEVLGEPDDMHSTDWAWQNSQKCFDCTFNGCYRGASLICAVPLSVMWALCFACVGFCHVWSISPLMHCLHINLASLQRILGQCVHCMCDPCWESTALLFSHIRVTNERSDC